MNRGPCALLFGALAAFPLSAQANFESASIKPDATLGTSPVETWELDLDRAAVITQHGHFRINGVPLSFLIQQAYSVRDFQLEGAPSWASSARYDIDAQAAGDATLDQMRPMLKSLLADRFKLTLHTETKELPVYELLVAKAGLKLTAAKAGSCVPRDANTSPVLLMGPAGRFCDGVERQYVTQWPQRIDGFNGTGITMPRLIDLITDDVHRTVLDKTAFTAPFDVHLEFVPAGAKMHTGPYPSAGAANPSKAAPPAKSRRGQSIFAALEAQLGLQLRSAKGPVFVLIIDHAEQPSEK